MKAGVVDPTKVVRYALENAASAASMFLTTECVVAELPEKKEKGKLDGYAVNALREQILQDVKLGFYTPEQGEQLLDDLAVLTGSSRLDNRTPTTEDQPPKIDPRYSTLSAVNLVKPDVRNMRGT